MRDKYAKLKSQEAYQQDWANTSQQPGEKFDGGKECLVKCVAEHAFRGLDYTAAPNTFPGDEPVHHACCLVRVDENREL